MDASLHYLKNQISTAAPEKVTAMLLERCQRAIQDTIVSIETSQPELRFRNTSKALEILSFLVLSASSEKESELSLNLVHIYTHCIEKLRIVSFKKDVVAAQSILTILAPIQSAYRQRADHGMMKNDAQADQVHFSSKSLEMIT